MAVGSLESRLSNIEELCIIIIIIIYGGGRGPGHGPVGDSATADTSRLEALMRLVRPGGPSIIPDPGPPDLARLSLEAVESRLLAVNAEMTRLRAQEGELNARVKELRGNKPK
jgi:hypothetical protein